MFTSVNSNSRTGLNGAKWKISQYILRRDFLTIQGDHCKCAASLYSELSFFWAFKLRPGGSWWRCHNEVTELPSIPKMLWKLTLCKLMHSGLGLWLGSFELTDIHLGTCYVQNPVVLPGDSEQARRVSSHSSLKWTLPWRDEHIYSTREWIKRQRRVLSGSMRTPGI